MPWVAGTFSRARGASEWQTDAANAVPILAGLHDQQDNDLATGINDCLNKNGQNSPTAPISLGGFNFTNVGNAAARNQFPSFGQVQDNAGKFGGTSAGTAAAQTIALTPALPAYVDGQLFSFIAGFTNQGAATLSIDGLAATPIFSTKTGAALVGGEIVPSMRCEVLYSGGTFWLLNPASSVLDGWSLIAPTGTFVSATSLTVAGDFTGIIRKGQPFSCVNSGSKAGYILSSSFGGGLTTINLVPNSDYSLVAAAITNVSIGVNATPLNFPGCFSYAATVTGFSVLPSQAVYRFAVHGNLCTLFVRHTTLGTSNATTFSITAPIVAANVLNMAWLVRAIASTDNGNNAPNALIFLPANSNVITVAKDDLSTPWTASGAKSTNFILTYEI